MSWKRVFWKKSKYPESEVVPVEGIRMIDVQHMAKLMNCVKCKAPLLMQKISSEKTEGYGSFFKIACVECSFLNTVTSSEQYQILTEKKKFVINSKIALGKIFS